VPTESRLQPPSPRGEGMKKKIREGKKTPKHCIGSVDSLYLLKICEPSNFRV